MTRRKAPGVVLAAILCLAAAQHGVSQWDGGVETVELTNKWGFYPQQIRRPSGRHALLLKNTTRLEGLEILLKDESGKVLKDWHIAVGRTIIQEPLDLAPGTYTLSVVGHPNWNMQLVYGR